MTASSAANHAGGTERVVCREPAGPDADRGRAETTAPGTGGQGKSGFGPLVAWLRNRRGLTQVELADLAEISTPSVQRGEASRRCAWGGSTAVAVLKALESIAPLSVDDRARFCEYAGLDCNIRAADPKSDFGSFLQGLRLERAMSIDTLAMRSRIAPPRLKLAEAQHQCVFTGIAASVLLQSLAAELPLLDTECRKWASLTSMSIEDVRRVNKTRMGVQVARLKTPPHPDIDLRDEIASHVATLIDATRVVRETIAAIRGTTTDEKAIDAAFKAAGIQVRPDPIVTEYVSFPLVEGEGWPRPQINADERGSEGGAA